MAKKKSFGEIWSELTDEQKEYLRDYINKQKIVDTENNKKKPHEDYIVQKHCELLIQVTTELKTGKREINDSIRLIQMLGNHLESFKQ